MEVGRQHHTQQHLSTQIITALSFSACVEDVMRFPHVSFHICAVKSASTHDVSRSVPRTLSTFTLMRNLPNWHAGPSEGFKHQPTSRAVLCRRLHACFCWLSLTGELNFHLYNGGMSVIICDSLQITCQHLPVHRLFWIPLCCTYSPTFTLCLLRVHKDNKLGQSAFHARANKSTNTSIIQCYR